MSREEKKDLAFASTVALGAWRAASRTASRLVSAVMDSLSFLLSCCSSSPSSAAELSLARTPSSEVMPRSLLMESSVALTLLKHWRICVLNTHPSAPRTARRRPPGTVRAAHSPELALSTARRSFS